MTVALYAGSFDPITKGHVDIIERAARQFDRLIVAIMENPQKHYFFDVDQRKTMIEDSIRGLTNVSVMIGSGLTVEFAKANGAGVLIRGIRAVSDYEYEMQQAIANQSLDDTIETFFLISRPQYSFLSSSIAKQIAYYGGDVSNLIPEAIVDRFKDRIKRHKEGK